MEKTQQEINHENSAMALKRAQQYKKEMDEDKIKNPEKYKVMATKKVKAKKELPELTPSEIGKVIVKSMVNKGNKKTSFKTFSKAMKPDEYITFVKECNKQMTDIIEESQKNIDKLKTIFPKIED